MTPERFERARELFERALELPESGKAAFVSQQCGDDRELQSIVADLLRRARSHQAEQANESAPAAGDRLIGNSVGPYRIRGVLGQGGMGTVYLAEQEKPVRRRVALKLIKLGMDTKEVVARFESERQALALMNHPNIASVLDAGTTDASSPLGAGRPYFAMEYVPGEPITAYCDKQRLTIRARLELFIQVCNAVQHAHQKAVIHRDIKPSNILVMLQENVGTGAEQSSGPRPVPKIIDFGVAKATNQRLSEHSVFTRHGMLIGTPEYMSPEQAEMTQLDIDTRTDIYSLGVLLYELLTGTLPFERETLRRAGLAEIQRIIREVEPAKPSTRLSGLAAKVTDVAPSPQAIPRTQEGERGLEIASSRVFRSTAKRGMSEDVAAQRSTELRSLIRDIRGDLDWIALKCLEKDRIRRYDTVAALASDLNRYLSLEPVLARPPNVAYRVRKFIMRNRAAVAFGAAISVLTLAGFIGTSVGLVSAQKEKSRAQSLAQQANVDRSEAIAARDQANRDRERAVRLSEFGQQILISLYEERVERIEEIMKLNPKAGAEAVKAVNTIDGEIKILLEEADDAGILTPDFQAKAKLLGQRVKVQFWIVSGAL